MDKIEKEGDYWVVYRISEWGKCPILKTKDKTQAEMLINKKDRF